MKNLKTLLFTFAAIVLFTACEKDETPETFDSISGILTAGENFSASDLSSLEIYLWKLHDSINTDQVNEETTAVNFVESRTLNADGTFAFSALKTGNYVITLDEGFLFGTNIFSFATIDGQTENKILETVELKAPDNSTKKYSYPSGRKHPGKIKPRTFKITRNFKEKMIESELFSFHIMEGTNLLYEIKPQQDNKWEIKVELDTKSDYTVELVFKKGEQSLSLPALNWEFLHRDHINFTTDDLVIRASLQRKWFHTTLYFNDSTSVTMKPSA